MKAAVVAAISIVLAGCSVQQRSSLDDFGEVPSFELVAQDGQTFHSNALAGKIWVADFIFTNCTGPWPRITSQMRQVQDAILKMPDVKLVSFTVDPARDTPPVLADYAKVHGALAAHWYFLTGSQATLNKLDREAFKLGNVDGSLEHSTRFALVDRRSHIRRYYDTSESDAISKLIADIYELARERS